MIESPSTTQLYQRLPQKDAERIELKSFLNFTEINKVDLG